MVTRRSQASGGLADEARFGQARRWERVCTAAAQVAETARRARAKDLAVEHRQRRQPDSVIDKKTTLSGLKLNTLELLLIGELFADCQA